MPRTDDDGRAAQDRAERYARAAALLRRWIADDDGQDDDWAAVDEELMTRSLTLDLPEEVEQALRKEAVRTGKSPEQVAVEWICSHVGAPPRGSAEALMLSHGTWRMTPEERARIERMIEEERLLEDAHARP